MAIGQDRLTLEALLTSLETIKFNKTENSTSEKIQKNDKDLAITLWNKIEALEGQSSIVNTTYEDLFSLISNSGLSVGTSYIFEFESIYDVANINSRNDTIGEPSVKEFLLVVANSVNTLNVEAISLNHIKDKVFYNPTSAPLSVGESKGVIYRRIETEANIDTPFDFRNHKVARFSLDSSAVLPLDSTIENALGSSSNSGFVFQAKSNSLICNNTSSNIDFDSTDFEDALLFENFILPRDTSAITFVDSIDINSCSNIVISANYEYEELINDPTSTSIRQLHVSKDLYIKNTSDLNITGKISNSTFIKTHGVTVNDKNKNLLIVQAGDFLIGSDNNSLLIYKSYYSSIGGQNTNLSLCSSIGAKIGSNNSIVRLSGGVTNASNYIGNRNVNIHITGRHNKIEDSNSDIVLEACNQVTLKNKNSLIYLLVARQVSISNFVTNLNFLNVGNEEIGGGAFERCKIGDNVNSIMMPNDGNVTDTIIEANCQSLTFNSSVTNSYFSPNIINLDISASGGPIEARFLNKNIESVSVTLPVTQSKTFYFKSENNVTTLESVDTQQIPTPPISLGSVQCSAKSSSLGIDTVLERIENTDDLEIQFPFDVILEGVSISYDSSSLSTAEAKIEVLSSSGNTFYGAGLFINTSQGTTDSYVFSSANTIPAGTQVYFKSDDETENGYTNVYATFYFKRLT